MKNVRPMMMQLAEPEYMCPECGAKFYAWHESEKPESCHGCSVLFDWKSDPIPESEEEFAELIEMTMRHATLEEQQWVQESIDKISKPTGFNFWDTYKDEPSPCDRCSNNPKNGGSGICWCTLGTLKITC